MYLLGRVPPLLSSVAEIEKLTSRAVLAGYEGPYEPGVLSSSALVYEDKPN